MNKLFFYLIVGFTSISVSNAYASAYPFEVLKLQSAKLPLERIMDGTVEAEHQSTVSAQTSGRVIDILYDVNDFVKKGAVLVRLNDTAQQAEKDRAEAGLDAAKSRFVEARDEQQRIQELHGRQLIAKSKLDAADAALNSARANVKSAEASLRQATEQVKHTIVKAPYSGIVTERKIELGEMATPGKPLMTGISLEELRVVVNVPQQAIVDIRKSGKARVILDDGREFESNDLTYFPFANPTTKSFYVRVHLAQTIEDIFPGMFVKVAFETGTTEGLRVPESAIVRRSELTGIYAIDEQTGNVSLRQVRLGRFSGGEVEILAGIDAGQTVALDPVAAGIYVKDQAKGSGDK